MPIKMSRFALFITLILPLVWGMPFVALAGYENTDMHDPTSSLGKSGVNTPREYFLPIEPAFEEIDPSELEDYHKTYYSPYAQLQIPRTLQLGQKIKLNQGYYLVKVDIVNIPTPPAQQQPQTQPGVLQPTTTSPPENRQKKEDAEADKVSYRKRKNFPAVDPAQPESDRRHRVCLVIKRAGEIEVVVPVASSSLLEKKMKKGRTTAELVLETHDPIKPQLLYLKYCARKICYRSAPLEPGLIQ